MVNCLGLSAALTRPIVPEKEIALELPPVQMRWIGEAQLFPQLRPIDRVYSLIPTWLIKWGEQIEWVDLIADEAWMLLTWSAALAFPIGIG